MSNVENNGGMLMHLFFSLPLFNGYKAKQSLLLASQQRSFLLRSTAQTSICLYHIQTHTYTYTDSRAHTHIHSAQF